MLIDTMRTFHATLTIEGNEITCTEVDASSRAEAEELATTIFKESGYEMINAEIDLEELENDSI